LKLENKKLQIKIQKETNRAKKAISDSKNVHEELNKVLHRLQTLESELKKIKILDQISNLKKLRGLRGFVKNK